MRNMKIYLMCIVLISLITACQSQPPKIQTRELITAKNYDKIMGMQWILQSMTIDAQSYQLTGENPFIQFKENSTVTGFASVNQFSGSFVFSSNRQITWPTPLLLTRMMGPENQMQQEDIFINTLPKTEQISISGNQLYLYTKNRSVEMVFYVPVQ